MDNLKVFVFNHMGVPIDATVRIESDRVMVTAKSETAVLPRVALMWTEP